MDEVHVVTCFLRNHGEVLLLRRSDAVGSYAGQWGAVSGHAEGDPDAMAREEIAEETGLADAVTLRRGGAPFDVVDAERGARWIVHPFLFEVDDRTVEPNDETAEYEWVHPTAILRRETVPDLWASYDRVRPTVEAVREDRDHGSAWLSIRALEILRDEAGVRTWGEGSGGWDAVAAIARDLRDARPSMPVVANRVNRVMARADRSPAAVEHIAREGLEAAFAADGGAAEHAAELLPDRIATLSRSGTVRTAIERADPEAVLVAQSRPGGEGVGVAEELAGERDVTIAADADLAWAIHEWESGAVIVGADAIRPDGGVLNKAGTRSAALAAAHEGVPVLVAAAADKVDADGEREIESVDPGRIYDGTADLTVRSPLFDVTPPELVDAICTDRGVLEPEDIEAVAAEHRANAEWEDRLNS
ncbi:methylthioribose-1-phosphate isomerase protein [Halorhabdus tiamatea SARL4B]|uniref:Initiation factor 2B related protein n=1 Tax=Halorhabdus tiamatea SARL4B TaxID=1033806 RepID=F7PK89_9EURY|nr:NUDIX domain-containing protein [Halorhabdus tiamatea]ERJ07623.1 methylthioribose-1-phosphate isomerase protein [Halorhabdus tiamatea SARL4B]CCQ33426.1 initiation factor 2B related protein [Halorhabdus tiamatea SARL4B]